MLSALRLRQRQRERESLLRRALESSDVERRRIASELHDGVVQDLAGVAFNLAAASRAFTYGSKMGIDATKKLPEEGFTREWPAVIEMDEGTRSAVDAMWPSLGIPSR